DVKRRTAERSSSETFHLSRFTGRGTAFLNILRKCSRARLAGHRSFSVPQYFSRGGLGECRELLFHAIQFCRERFPPGGEPHKFLLPAVLFQVQSAPLGGFIFVDGGVGQ